MRFINFGSLNNDVVLHTDHFVRAGETTTAGRMELFPGGKGLNQSIAITRAGGTVSHAGCWGKGGEALCALLEEENVCTRYLEQLDVPQGQAVIQVTPEGENGIIVYAGSNACLEKSRIDEILNDCGEEDVILLQNEVSNVSYIVDSACARGIRVVFNPSPMDGAAKQMDWGKLWWLLINEVEGEQITGVRKWEEMIAALRKSCPRTNVLLTLGGQGAVCLWEGRIIRQDAFVTQVVDTTGAGDTFTGYFLTGLAAGEVPEQILRTASAAASLCVSRSGAAPSIPAREEVERANLTPRR